MCWNMGLVSAVIALTICGGNVHLSFAMKKFEPEGSVKRVLDDYKVLEEKCKSAKRGATAGPASASASASASTNKTKIVEDCEFNCIVKRSGNYYSVRDLLSAQAFHNLGQTIHSLVHAAVDEAGGPPVITMQDRGQHPHLLMWQ